MGATLTTADAALKEDYQPAVREQLNNKNMLLSYIESRSEENVDIEGRRAVLSLHVSRNSGVGARTEGSTLPTAGNQGYAEERVPLKYNYGRLNVSGPSIKAMKSNKGSFVRQVDSETKALVNDLKRDVNRQIWGTTDGVIAATGVTSASTTVVLATATTATQLRQLEVGMLIDIGTVAAPQTIASARTIVSINTSAKTLVISGAAVTTATTDRIFRSGIGASNGTGSAQGVELTGLQTIVDDTGTLFNVNPTTYPSWAATDLNNSGTPRAITENLLETLLMDTEVKSGSQPNLIVTSQGVFRAYSALLTSVKRFNDTNDLKGGFKGLSISAGGAEVKFLWDQDCPTGTVFALNTDHLFQYQSSDWEFMDDDGAVLSRVSGTDAYEAVLYKYHELTTDKRNAHGVLRDITES